MEFIIELFVTAFYFFSMLAAIILVIQSLFYERTLIKNHTKDLIIYIFAVLLTTFIWLYIKSFLF